MVKIFNKVWDVSFAGPTPSEAGLFRDAATADNIYRERILAALILGASLLLMILDYAVLVLSPESYRSPSGMVIIFRLSFCAFLLLFLFVTRQKPGKSSRHYLLWDPAMVGVSLAWVGVFSGALLVVRPGIELYLMGVLITGCFLFQGVGQSMLFYAVGYLGLISSALYFRPEAHILLSALVNAALVTLLAFVISRIGFRMRLQSFRDAQNIAGQRKLMQESVEHLQKLSYLDPLTGIANRRFLETSLSREWKLESRSGRPLSVIMIDIDWFKLFNDTYGHIPGDECLRQVAVALESAVRRPSDLVSRYGGEEFCILLPVTEREGAIFTAKRIMKAIHAMKVLHHSSPIGQVTVSIGIATKMPHYSDHYDSLIQSADKALYHAKISGKNRIAWCCPVAMEESPDTEKSSTLLHKSITLDFSADCEMENWTGAP